MDLLLPLRDPGYFQSVYRRLDGGQSGISLAGREIDPRDLPKARHPAGAINGSCRPGFFHEVEAGGAAAFGPWGSQDAQPAVHP